MPTFRPSVAQNAVVSLTITPVGVACEARIYLGTNNEALSTPAIVQFTSDGTSQSLPFVVPMPSVVGIYSAYIDLYIDGEIVARYVGTEQITVEALNAATAAEVLSFTLTLA